MPSKTLTVTYTYHDKENTKIKDITWKNSDNQHHNPNGPAYEYYYKNGQLWIKAYYLNNQYHNPNGPAWEHYYENGQLYIKEYWIKGIKYSFENYTKELQKNNNPCLNKIITIDGKQYKLQEL